MLKTQIRMQWTFSGCDSDHSRIPIAFKMLELGMSQEAVDKVVGNNLIVIADVIIHDDGEMIITDFHKMEKCNSFHENGERCSKNALHGIHHASIKQNSNGIEVLHWKK